VSMSLKGRPDLCPRPVRLAAHLSGRGIFAAYGRLLRAQVLSVSQPSIG
jgi:hypothetical protein